jgi:HAE1 family hydrophobic/amphiphilic exporter-1
MLILLGKNAVLIVEFAIQRHAAGKSVLEAAMEGEQRFRPILMTSFAFIAGLLPLVFATGPGKIGNRNYSRSRRDAYWYHLWCIPGLYYIFGRIAEKYKLVK